MLIYLPIAEQTVNVFALAALGVVVGMISGMFGIGGGFLMTPLLVFFGIPTPIAVASVTGQIAASSLSGGLSYWRDRLVDVRLCSLLVAGGLTGTGVGVMLFRELALSGYIEIVIAIGFFSMLAVVGSLMLAESLRTAAVQLGWIPSRSLAPRVHHSWIHGLPLRVKFRTSRLYSSALPVVAIGFGIGVLGAVFGIGGGFMLVPALIYLLHVPTRIVIGTSMFHVGISMSVACLLYAALIGNVDIVLAMILTVGAAIGTQLGVRMGAAIPGEFLRLILAFVILAVAVRFGVGFLVAPEDPFTIAPQVMSL